jgi:soluble lytic murein transglycosylase-like protein
VTRRPITLLALALSLLAPVAAQAETGVARIIGPDGRPLATAVAQAGWVYPADGSLVQIADVTRVGRDLDLEGISLLGGRLRVHHARVGRASSVGGATVDGLAVEAGANRVVSIPGVGWALVLQRAVVPLRNGRTRTTTVAVRLHLMVARGGLPAGSEVLVGLAGGSYATPVLTGAAVEIPAGLIPVYRAAARAYGVPWAVLAAINRVETSFGANLSISSAGAVGWMQFMPTTWASYGVDANGDGRANPYDARDAIFAAARLLQANGAAGDLRTAVFMYNHSTSYVDLVLRLARAYADGTAAAPATVAGAAGIADDNGLLFSPITLW